MESRLRKWGNSLGLRIPMHIAKQLQLHPGSAVKIKIEEDRIIIQLPKYDLDTMLKGITSKNRHHQMLEDDPRGNRHLA